jgi:DNA adenine methylase
MRRGPDICLGASSSVTCSNFNASSFWVSKSGTINGPFFAGLFEHLRSVFPKTMNGIVYPKAPTRRLIHRASERRGKMIAFGYYGGKFSHLDFILPLLPTTYTHYCEPFAGSAAVLINRIPAPLETYNDLDSEVVNFFETLRDSGDALIRAISLTPFSREELVRACAPAQRLTNVERARRFFVRARQTRTGLAQTSSEGRWAHCVLTSRAAMAGAVSRWLGSVDRLPEIVQRLQRVQIENAPATEVIRRYDSAQTLFYCDPPYVHESRGDSKAYRFEMNDREHANLADILRSCKGAVAISGYRSPLMDRLFKNWVRVDAETRLCHSTKEERVESVWMNYQPPKKIDLVNDGPAASYLLDRRK